jgi:predicted ATP-dependent Lon-type protease
VFTVAWNSLHALPSKFTAAVITSGCIVRRAVPRSDNPENITPVGNLAESLQVAHDAGTKRVLSPMTSASDIPAIPGELFAKFQTSFYSDARDAAFKSPGVE